MTDIDAAEAVRENYRQQGRDEMYQAVIYTFEAYLKFLAKDRSTDTDADRRARQIGTITINSLRSVIEVAHGEASRK